MGIYRITGDQDSIIERTTTLFERRHGAPGRSWTVTSTHETAVAHTDDQVAPTPDDYEILCEPRLGYALGRALEMSFTFDDAISATEQRSIQEGWSYAHSYGIDLVRWIIEEDYIKISNPESVDLLVDIGSLANAA